MRYIHTRGKRKGLSVSCEVNVRPLRFENSAELKMGMRCFEAVTPEMSRILPYTYHEKCSLIVCNIFSMFQLYTSTGTSYFRFFFADIIISGSQDSIPNHSSNFSVEHLTTSPSLLRPIALGPQLRCFAQPFIPSVSIDPSIQPDFPSPTLNNPPAKPPPMLRITPTKPSNRVRDSPKQ